jgi:hypothetical protein
VAWSRQTKTGALLINLQKPYWTFDHFFYHAAKRSLRERFAAYFIFAAIFPATLTPPVLQEKSAQFSQKFKCVMQRECYMIGVLGSRID